MSDDPFLSVVIPVYEGERVIRRTIDAVQAHATERGWPIEIVVGYSRGADRTDEVLKRACGDYRNLTVVDTTARFGKGGAIRGAMGHASGTIRCFIDADSGVSFDQVDMALELVEHHDIVVGSRYIAGGSAGSRSFTRVALSRGGNLLMRLLLGLRFADTRAPLKVYRGEVADRLFPALRLNGFGFDTELLFLAEKFGYRTVEFPVRWASSDQTTVNIPLDAVRSIVELLQIRWYWLRRSYPADLGPELSPASSGRAG